MSDEKAERGSETCDRLDQTIATVAEEKGATLHTYPRSDHAVRRVVFREVQDTGTRFEAAQIEDDGALRVVGHGTGSRVSDFFGTTIASFEWVYVVSSGRVKALLPVRSAAHRHVSTARPLATSA